MDSKLHFPVIIIIIIILASIPFSVCIQCPSKPASSKGFSFSIYHGTHPRIQKHLDPKAVAPFHGNRSESYLYYVEVLFGTPRVERTLVLDTGSMFTWLNVSEEYNPFLSSTDTPVPCSERVCKDVPSNNYCYSASSSKCQFELKYGDNRTVKGDVARDNFFLFTDADEGSCPAPVDVYMIFGGAINNTHKLRGVLGVSTHRLGLMTVLNVKHMSMCFPKTYEQKSLVRFGSDSVISEYSTPLLTSLVPYKWIFLVESIYVGDSLVGGGGGTFLFDTGAAFSYLHPDIMDSLIELVLDYLGDDPVLERDGFELCFEGLVRSSDLVIYFDLGGGDTISISGDVLWYVSSFDACLAFRRSWTGRNIFGVKQMAGRNFGIDLIANKLTFDEVDC